MFQAELKPYHQSRWVCLRHGFFDVRLPQRPADSYKASCPECETPSISRDGYECTGKTTGPVPYRSKPRLEETPELEVALFENAKVVKNRKGYFDRHARQWKQNKR